MDHKEMHKKSNGRARRVVPSELQNSIFRHELPDNNIRFLVANWTAGPERRYYYMHSLRSNQRNAMGQEFPIAANHRELLNAYQWRRIRASVREERNTLQYAARMGKPEQSKILDPHFCPHCLPEVLQHGGTAEYMMADEEQSDREKQHEQNCCCNQGPMLPDASALHQGKRVIGLVWSPCCLRRA